MNDFFDVSLETSAILAIRHFNSRDSTVVPELSLLAETCNTKFVGKDNLTIDSETAQDAIVRLWGFIPHHASKVLLGPSSSELLETVSPVANGFDVALFDHFSGLSDQNVVTMTLSMKQRAKALLEHMKQPSSKLRELGILYEEDSTGERTMARYLKRFGKDSGVEISSFPMFSGQDQARVLTSIKKSGVRTLYLGVKKETDLGELARLMDSTGLLADDFIFIISHQTYESNRHSTNPSAIDLLTGSIVFDRLDPFNNPVGEREQFLSSWREVYGTNEYDFPAAGSSFVYDSIMAMGFSHCNDSLSFASGLSSTKFQGASGEVRFSSVGVRDSPTAVRDQDTVLVGAFNIRKSASTLSEKVLTGVYTSSSGWQAIEGSKIIYRSGLPYAPATRNDNPAHGIGLIAITAASLICTITGILVFVYMKEPPVRRTQPFYLGLICLGSALSCVGLAPLPRGYAEPGASLLCTGVTFVLPFGMLTTSSALFTKSWRVYQAALLNEIRRPTGWKVFSVPLVLLSFLLLVWVIFDPISFERSTSQLGVCTSVHKPIFSSFCCFMIVYMEAFALLFSWRTMNKDIPREFRDNEEIIGCQLLRLYTLLVGAMMYFFSGMSNQPRTPSVYNCFVALGLIVSFSPVVIVVAPRLLGGMKSNLVKCQFVFHQESKIDDSSNNVGTSRTKKSVSLRSILSDQDCDESGYEDPL